MASQTSNLSKSPQMVIKANSCRNEDQINRIRNRLNDLYVMFLSLIFVFLLSTSIAPPSLAAAAASCHPDDARALLELKKSFGNPPALASWGNASVDCCFKDFIRCDVVGGRITNLVIGDDAGLSGRISPSIARLAALSYVVILQNPNLTGPIPASIGKLSNLTTLRLLANPRLSGPIPPSICVLPKLTNLDLSGNSLTGSIPDCIGKKLTRLSWIFLDRNQLTGPIPRSLGDSPVPIIGLGSNRLTGDASFLFGEKKGTEWIDLSNNQLDFDLSNVRFPLRLTGLILNNNRIYGRIPPQISKLGRIVFFNASYNSLCGPVPTAGFMKIFDASAFEHNKCLCGGPLKPCPP